MSEMDSKVDGDESDEEPQLSQSALAALNEFLTERNLREERLQQIAQAAVVEGDNLLNEIELEEDWVIFF